MRPAVVTTNAKEENSRSLLGESHRLEHLSQVALFATA